MGNGCTICAHKPHGNRVTDLGSRSEASLEELKGDTFTDQVIKVPVDYNQKAQHKKGNSRSLRSVGSFRKSLIRKTTSLHSSVSVRLDTELERLKRELQTYKYEKQEEIMDFQLQVDRLSSENKRLRGELKMLQATCTKLKGDREKAMQGEKAALERSGAFETERDKVQRQFKLFREAKENELQNLLKNKRVLETKLQKYTSCDDNETKVHDYLGEGGELIGNPGWMVGIENEPVVACHGNARGLEYGAAAVGPQEPYTDIKKGDWDSAVQNLVKSLSASIMSIPEDNVFKVYVSATNDLKDAATALVNKHCKELNITCGFEGRFLLLIYFTDDDNVNTDDLNENLKVRLEHVRSCDIFVALIGQKFNRYNAEEIQDGVSRKPGLKHTLIFKSEESTSYPSAIKCELKSGPRVKTFQYSIDDSNDEISKLAASHIENIVQQFLVEQRGNEFEGKIQPIENEDFCVGCGWDVYSDHEQAQALQFFAREDAKGIALEKYFEQLSEHISVDGPSQPLLVTGAAGVGKSMLLARWIKAQNGAPSAPTILYHFIGVGSSFSADAVQIMRRLTVHLIFQPPSVCDPAKLEDEFPKWLDKAPGRLPHGVIIVLDGADNLQIGNSSLKWLVDPLPVGVHVIVSARQDCLRKEMRSWPTVHIESLSDDESKQLLVAEWKNTDIVVNSELLNNILDLGDRISLANPGFLSILVTELSSCTSYQELNDALITFLKAKDLVQLFKIILSKLELEFPSIVEKVLGYIFFSRSGLSESEIFELFNPGWLTWSKLLKKLEKKRLVAIRDGLIIFTNEEVRQAVEQFYDIDWKSEKVKKWRLDIIEIFRVKLIPGRVPYRVADELPWQLLQMDMKQELKECLSVFCIFFRLYRRGRCTELIHYWKELDIDIAGMADIYLEFVKTMERDPVHGPNTPPMYDALGMFLKEAGQLSLAIKPLERALEIRESTLDPDDPRTGQSFHHLAGLYNQWKKFRTAITMYKQALEIKENSYGPNHPSVAKELEALSMLYFLQDRPDLAEPLCKKAAAIYQQYYREQSSSATTATLQKCAEQLQDIASTNMSPEIGKCLNDLGVLFFIQNNNELAESFFRRALEMREQTLGNDHPDVAQSLHNLAALYNDQKLYNQAEKLYEEALVIRLKHFSPENPSLQSTLKHLAGLNRRQGKLVEAEKLYSQLLELREQIMGPNHPNVALALNNLAVLLCQMGKHKEALPHYERAIRIYEEHFGPGHPRVADILRNVAKVCYDMGDLHEAARLYKQATETSRSGYQLPTKALGARYSSREELLSRRRNSSSRHSSISSMIKPAPNNFNT